MEDKELFGLLSLIGASIFVLPVAALIFVTLATTVGVPVSSDPLGIGLVLVGTVFALAIAYATYQRGVAPSEIGVVKGRDQQRSEPLHEDSRGSQSKTDSDTPADPSAKSNGDDDYRNLAWDNEFLVDENE